MFNAKKSDKNLEKFKLMNAFRDKYDDMPDGAFFAMADELFGWDFDDWGWFSEVEELNV